MNMYYENEARIFESVYAAIIMNYLRKVSEIAFCNRHCIEKTPFGEGFFSESIDGIESMTAINHKEIKKALKVLKKHDFIEIKFVNDSEHFYVKIN